MPCKEVFLTWNFHGGNNITSIYLRIRKNEYGVATKALASDTNVLAKEMGHLRNEYRQQTADCLGKLNCFSGLMLYFMYS